MDDHLERKRLLQTKRRNATTSAQQNQGIWSRITGDYYAPAKLLNVQFGALFSQTSFWSESSERSRDTEVEINKKHLPPWKCRRPLQPAAKKVQPPNWKFWRFQASQGHNNLCQSCNSLASCLPILNDTVPHFYHQLVIRLVFCQLGHPTS